MKTFILSLCLIMALLPGLFANNVVMENISLCDQTIATHQCNIMFDISWENSWRTSNTVPTNWDACWVFAKFRITGGNWHHCTLSNVAGDFTSPSGCTITPGDDAKGIFIYRTEDGSGNINWDQLKLPWKYGIDGVSDDAEVEVKLFAIEMVYINWGDFYLGDGNGINESEMAFHVSDDLAVQINSTLVPGIKVDLWSVIDDAALISGIGIEGDGGLDTDNNGTIDNAYWPTGWRQFYMMKYEISQEQYAAFLNTLTRAQQQARIATDISGTSITNVFVMSNTTSPSSGNTIRCASTIAEAPTPVIFFCDNNMNGQIETCDGQTLQCNMLSWPDLCAYADWAALRPMTELEYEKACRGPNNPVLGEYAWGNTSISLTAVSQTNYACPNSSIVLNPNEHIGRAMCAELGDVLIGLRRCGEFASSSLNHTRQEAGAGYFGVMELSGSMAEPVVFLGNAAGRSFRAINGNGELNNAGHADVDYWPGINGNSNVAQPNLPYAGSVGVTQSAGSFSRGGNLSLFHNGLMVSYRYNIYSSYAITRDSWNGARFVRNAF